MAAMRSVVYCAAAVLAVLAVSAAPVAAGQGSDQSVAASAVLEPHQGAATGVAAAAPASVVTKNCTGMMSCKGDLYTCPAGVQATVYCEGLGACAGLTVRASHSPNSDCNIVCSGNSACNRLTVQGPGSWNSFATYSALVRCTGMGSCASMTISNCPAFQGKSLCAKECTGFNSCKN